MKLNQTIKSFLLYGLRISITVGLLIFLFFKVDVSQIIAVIKTLHPALFIAGAFFWILIIQLAIVRWYLLVRASGIAVPFRRAFISYYIGLFFNMFLPSCIGGDIVRSFDLFEFVNDKSKLFATVLLDRLSGFISVVVVSFIALVFGHRLINDTSVWVTFGILAIMSFGVLLLCFSRRVFKLVVFFFGRFPSVKNALLRFNEATVFFRNRKKDLVINLLISLALRLGVIIVFYVVALAGHQRINVLYFFIFVPIIEAISAVPIAIGGLGVRDAAAVFLFSKVGVASNIAMSMSLVNFFFMVFVGFLGGIIYVLTLRSRRI